MVVRKICEICLSNVDDVGEGCGGILMMHKGVRRRYLVVVRAMGNICLNVVDEGGEGGGGVEAIFAAVDIVVSSQPWLSQSIPPHYHRGGDEDNRHYCRC